MMVCFIIMQMRGYAQEGKVVALKEKDCAKGLQTSAFLSQEKDMVRYI